MTLLVDVNRSGSQEDLVSNWEPAHTLVDDAVSGAEIAPCLPALAVSYLPLCLLQVRASLQPASSSLDSLRRNSRILPQLEKIHVVPPSSQDEALSRYSVSGEVPR